MGIGKEKLTIQEVERRNLEQKRITAEYLKGRFGDGTEAVEIYRGKMDEVATPLDLVALASEINFKPLT